MADSVLRSRVLVVDDAPEVARRIAALLAELDLVQVLGPATGGHEALALFEAERPDVVVLDVHMPPPDGLQVLERIRRSGRACLVVMLTSHSEPSIRARCLELGADAFLDKAGEVELLPELIREHLRPRDGA